MKNILLLAALLCGVTMSINAQNVKTLEAEGNLESTMPCECVKLSELTNKHTPADYNTRYGRMHKKERL